MKIALVGKRFSRSWGGAERVGVELAKALRAAGHEVRVFAETIEKGEQSVCGVEVTRIPTTKSASALRVLSFHRSVAKVVRPGDFDVVFGLTQFFPLSVFRAGGGVHAHWMRLRYENALVRTFKYIFSPVHLVMAWLEKNITKPENHRLVIANSRLVREHLKKYFDLDDDRIKVVYNGVDHDVFSPGVKSHRAKVRKELGISSDRLVGLFVSNNWERKGLRTIVRALSGDKDITIVVVGRGRKDKFAALIKECGLAPEAVVFAGVTEDVHMFYGAADFYLLPTQYDPASNTCFEAMACELPVITTATNGACELIEDSVSGYILKDWKDHAGLKRYLDLLKDDDLRLAMGRSAAEGASALTWERMAAETVSACEVASVESG